jgi:hypothetical protein
MDEQRFTEAYPQANGGTLSQLLAAIREKQNRRRASKNGTPRERDEIRRLQKAAKTSG